MKGKGWLLGVSAVALVAAATTLTNPPVPPPILSEMLDDYPAKLVYESRATISTPSNGTLPQRVTVYASNEPFAELVSRLDTDLLQRHLGRLSPPADLAEWRTTDGSYRLILRPGTYYGWVPNAPKAAYFITVFEPRKVPLSEQANDLWLRWTHRPILRPTITPIPGSVVPVKKIAPATLKSPELSIPGKPPLVGIPENRS